MRIKMGYPSHETERQILRSRTTDESVGALEPIADVSDVLAMQEAVTRSEGGQQLARLRAGNCESHAQVGPTRTWREPTGDTDAAAGRTSARVSGRARILPARRFQAAGGGGFFAPRCGQHAARFLAKKVGDHGNGAPRDCRFRPRTPVNLRASLANVWEKTDRPGVRAFFLSMAALSVAFVLALVFRSGRANRQSGTGERDGFVRAVGGGLGRSHAGAGVGETDAAALDQLSDGVPAPASRMDLHWRNRPGGAGRHQYRKQSFVPDSCLPDRKHSNVRDSFVAYAGRRGIEPGACRNTFLQGKPCAASWN